MSFKIDFNMEKFRRWGVIPDVSEYMEGDVILNAKEYKAGNINECVWKRHPDPEVISKGFIKREVTRVLRTGVFIYIKETLVWLPPNYYFFLQYGQAGGDLPQFRLKRLKHKYFKIWVRNKPKAIGTYTIKNRQDGETTDAVTDAIWEAADGNMDNGTIGMQSKTNKTVIQSCWRNTKMTWNMIPAWLKKAIYDDFSSGDRIATTLKFNRLPNGKPGDRGRDIVILYGASVHNAFDSQSNMRRCILDEVNKWKECSFYDTFTNYKQFIAPGSSRKGIFDMFSSPADVNGKWNDEAYVFWEGSKWEDQPDDYIPETRVFRWYSDPLEGIEGMYDRWGDIVGKNEIYDYIMAERKAKPPDKVQGEIRANPLSEEEMFGSFDTGSLWSNHKGILTRKVELGVIRFKSSVTKEPARIYGNLEWKNGVIDSDVVFRQADANEFDLRVARFCFSHIPPEREPLNSIYTPPGYVEDCLGIDPYNNHYATKNPTKQSTGAMINLHFRDVLEIMKKCCNLYYDIRPQQLDIFFEDAIKAAIFNRAMVQYENKSDKLSVHFDQRGYHKWLLPEMGAKPPKDGTPIRTGDAPGGKGKFLNEGLGLLDSFFNLPINPPEDPYYLEDFWFPAVLDQVLKFNPKDTEQFNAVMAMIQAFIGAAKISYKKIKEPSDIGVAAISYLRR